jgi:hypothetical protein
MTARQLSAHVVANGDTVDYIVSHYGLSSSAALRDIPANQSLKSHLSADGPLPAGLLIYIPPRAGLLVRNRLYCLQSIRPGFIAHFDDCRQRLEDDVAPAVLKARKPGDDPAVHALLMELCQVAGESIEAISRAAQPLIPVCQGLVLTHVADDTDHAVAGAADDPLCSLYWCITPPLLEFWRGFWEPSAWREKWQDRTPEAAFQLQQQQLNTLSSLVVQQVDQRIRNAQILENALRSGK